MYCKCGQQKSVTAWLEVEGESLTLNIGVSSKWNGLVDRVVFKNDKGQEIDECPGCGENGLLSEPPNKACSGLAYWLVLDNG